MDSKGGYNMNMVPLIATTLVLLHAHISTSGATLSCCSEERRGTVCTLAGNGDSNSEDGPNASTAAFYWPIGVALSPPHNIVVSGRMEHRLRVIHHNGSVSTLAGGGPIGEYVGSYVDSDNPLDARFSNPTGICSDSEGNVFVCDAYNHRIRVILRNGSVRTLAGSGSEGDVDNTDPLRAKFYYPWGITSSLENWQQLIIIGGDYDHRIRVIYANRTVSTMAGSGGIGLMNCEYKDSANPLTARFCHPLGVAQDHSGNTIVTEECSGHVRKVWRDGSQSGVTTIAGNGPISNQAGSSIDNDNPLEASFFSPRRCNCRWRWKHPHLGSVRASSSHHPRQR